MEVKTPAVPKMRCFCTILRFQYKWDPAWLSKRRSAGDEAGYLGALPGEFAMTTTTIQALAHAFSSDLGWMAVAWGEGRLLRLTLGHPSGGAATASIEADLNLPVSP